METVIQFRKNGFNYTLHSSGEKSFIYRQTYSEKPAVFYFEVFEKKIQSAGERFGKFYPEQIRFPGNEDFGKWAWTYRDEKKAIAKFNQIENESKRQLH